MRLWPIANHRSVRITDFAQLLVNISRKKVGQPIPEDDNSKMSVVMICSETGRYSDQEDSGMVYIRYIKKALQKGINIFYILATGEQNTHVATLVAEYLLRDSLLKMSHRYARESGNGSKALSELCIRLVASQTIQKAV